jgi:hypothetical protein
LNACDPQLCLETTWRGKQNMPGRSNEELYEAAYKFLTEQGHKISFRFVRSVAGRSSNLPKLDVDGREMSREQLIALATTYSGWKRLQGQ